MSKIPAAARHNTWVAEYGVSKNKYYEHHVMWQYTSSGSVSGIKGRVDLSYVVDVFDMNASESKTPVKEEPKKE